MLYMIKYRCRLCGETYHSGCTGSNDIILKVTAELATTGYSRVLQAPTMVAPHCCSDGSIGMADFLGFYAYEETEKE